MSHDPFAALAASGQRKLAAAAATPIEGTLLPPTASPTHAAVGGMLDELLGLLDRMAGSAPAGVRAMLGMVKGSRGMMLDGLLSMPDEQLVGILHTLRDRIDAVPGVTGR